MKKYIQPEMNVMVMEASPLLFDGSNLTISEEEITDQTQIRARPSFGVWGEDEE